MAPQPPTTGLPRLATPLTDKLTRLVPLSPEENAVLGDLQPTIAGFGSGWKRPRSTRATRRARRTPSSSKHHLARGFHRFSRVLLRKCAVFHHCAHRLCRLCSSIARLLSFFQVYPRLAATIFWSFSCEAAMYLIDIGR